MIQRLPARTVLPIVAGVLLAWGGVQLGQWQLRRAGEKTELQQRMDRLAAEPLGALAAGFEPQEWRSVQLRGRWLADGGFLIDNRVHQGRAGYHAVGALELEDGRVVLVNRGWIAAASDRLSLPAVQLPAGPVELAGIVRIPEVRPFRLAEDPRGSRLRQHLVPAELAAALGRSVQPWVLQQTSVASDGLLRDWPRPDAGIDRHRGYAVQWFGLAGLAAFLTVFLGWRGVRHGQQA